MIREGKTAWERWREVVGDRQGETVVVRTREGGVEFKVVAWAFEAILKEFVKEGMREGEGLRGYPLE